MRSAAIIYLLWAVFLISIGLYAMHKITDKSNPKSLINSMQKLNETMNEYP